MPPNTSTTSDNAPWQQIASPALFARTVTQHLPEKSRWKLTPHLQAIDRELTDSIRQGDGRLILSVPPRHGKSELASKYFPAWFVGAFPHRRVILSSYEADFASSWGRKARTLLDEQGHRFGVKVARDSSAANRWDVEGHGGGMTTAGVGGPITGKGADLLIIDDPVKNYEEAHSQTFRDRAWDWFTSTAYTRLEPGATCVVIMTRWHEDDLVGRIKTRLGHENWRDVLFPALCEVDGDSLGRRRGDPLWPERFDAARLAAIKATLGGYQFSSLYQQRPTPEEGGMFKREWLSRFVDAVPNGCKRCRGWDKAATENAGDHSAGVLLAVDDDGIFYVEHVERGQWSSGARNKIIYQTAELDVLRAGRDNYAVWVEREGGSGGKESAEISVRELAGFDAHAELVTGDKVARSRAFAAQCEAGNVRLVRGGWNEAYISELCGFPNGSNDDQVDASSLAFNKLVLVKPLKFQFW